MWVFFYSKDIHLQYNINILTTVIWFKYCHYAIKHFSTSQWTFWFLLNLYISTFFFVKIFALGIVNRSDFINICTMEYQFFYYYIWSFCFHEKTKYC